MRHDRADDAALIHARRRARRRLPLAGGSGLLAALPPLSGPLWAEGAFAGSGSARHDDAPQDSFHGRRASGRRLPSPRTRKSEASARPRPS
jgi:hypothetical protein